MDAWFRTRGLCKVAFEFHATIPHSDIKANFERSRNMTTVDDAEKEKGSAAVAPILLCLRQMYLTLIRQGK